MKRAKRIKTKDELLKSNKRKKIIILALVLILAYFVIQNVIHEFKPSSSSNGDYNQTEKEDGLSDKIGDGLIGFVEGVVELKYPFMIKFFIFLGAIYIIQVGISITGDIIQLILIMGVFIIRIMRWLSYKIRGKEYDRR